MLKSDSHLPKNFALFAWLKNVFYLVWKALFVLKNVFVTTFWSCRKNGLIRKTRLTSRFMTSQPGLETIAIHILSNISQSKGNQTMKLVQTSSRPLFISLKKANMSWKQVVCSLVWIYFDSPHLPYSKNKLHKVLVYRSRDTFNFDFSRKMFLVLHSINWPNSICLIVFTHRDIGQHVY